jgi:hypothetical protein
VWVGRAVQKSCYHIVATTYSSPPRVPGPGKLRNSSWKETCSVIILASGWGCDIGEVQNAVCGRVCRYHGPVSKVSGALDLVVIEIDAGEFHVCWGIHSDRVANCAAGCKKAEWDVPCADGGPLKE